MHVYTTPDLLCQNTVKNVESQEKRNKTNLIHMQSGIYDRELFTKES